MPMFAEVENGAQPDGRARPRRGRAARGTEALEFDLQPVVDLPEQRAPVDEKPASWRRPD